MRLSAVIAILASVVALPLRAAGDDAPLVDAHNRQALLATAQSDALSWIEEEPGILPAASSAMSGTSGEPWGAERASAEDDRPRIPEPLVFDLMRPLGARRGEFEINTLGIVPFRRRVPRASDIPDPVGLIFTDTLPRIEWAPEVEYAVRDNFAIEFELPMEDGLVAAYKAGAQYTFGTAFQQRMVHGVQGIVQYDLHDALWVPTCVYIVGIRFNENWSTLNMVGLRGVINADQPGNRVERILNLNLFRGFSPHATAGVEANFAANMRGQASLLLMPQLHWEWRDHCMVQAGPEPDSPISTRSARPLFG